MKNLFRADIKGMWSTSEGELYTVVAVDESTAVKFPKKDGWRSTLDEALAVKKSRAKKDVEPTLGA